VIAHAASVAAILIDQVMAAPPNMPYAQAACEPDWKWWLKLLVDILGPLLSTAGSIYVAWRVFRWQGAKDRAAWVHDREMAEWSTVLSALTAVDMRMPHVFNNMDWPTLTDGLLQEFRSILPAMRNAVFIADELDNEGLIGGFRVFVGDSAEKIERINNLTAVISGPGAYESVSAYAEANKIKLQNIEKREAAYRELYDQFHGHAARIRKIARKSLIPATPEEEEQEVGAGDGDAATL